MSLGLCRREYRQRSCGSFRPDLCNRAEPVLPRGTWRASTAGESPPGETGLSHGEPGRGTSRFMSRSMDADKGSTDDRAGSGPRASLLVRWLGALGVGVIWRNRFARASTSKMSSALTPRNSLLSLIEWQKKPPTGGFGIILTQTA